MWFDEAVVYQIYPLGLCGVLNEKRSSDDSVVGHSILEVKDWISHIKKLGATCVLFNPLMESDYHGYDTRDYYTPVSYTHLFLSKQEFFCFFYG